MRKFLSRKFILAAVGVLVGIGVATGLIIPGGAGVAVELISGGVITVLSILGYELSEGWVDGKRAEKD